MMKGKMLQRLIQKILLAAVFLFSSCDFDTFLETEKNEAVKSYLDYWSSTCQFAEVRYLSAHTEINGVQNLSSAVPFEIHIATVNPQNYKLLNKQSGYCFKFTNEDGNLSYSDYSETTDDNLLIKITATFTDESEGQEITLSGGLWPENRSNWEEDALKDAAPELFTSVKFIQNTPPDNVKNMRVPDEYFAGTFKHYVVFELPDLSLNKNKGSSYSVSYYLREDERLIFKETKTLELSDNMGTQPYFSYYFENQEDYLPYEYTVRVIGPRGLKSELYSTDPGLGVREVNEATLTIENEFNGLSDEEGFECIEVVNDNEPVTYTAAAAMTGDNLVVEIDGVESELNGTFNGIGQHTIVVTSYKDGCRPVSIYRKVRIVRTPAAAEFTFSKEFNGCGLDKNGYEYIEVENTSSTINYTITSPDENTRLSGSVDDEAFEEKEETESGSLNVNYHTLSAVVHKDYCLPVKLEKKICVVQSLQKPELRIYNSTTRVYDTADAEDTSYSASNGYETYNISLTSSGTGSLSYELYAAGSNETVSVLCDDSQADFTGTLPLGPHEFKYTVTKPNYTSKEFTQKVYVQGLLSEPSLSFTGTQDGTQNGYPLYKFSYLTYEAMPFSVYAGNTGNTMVVKIDNTEVTSSQYKLSHDTTPSISVVQTRRYCKTSSYSKTIAVKIKTVAVSVGNTALYCNFGDSGDENEICGTVYLGKNYSYQELRNFDEADFAQYRWDSFDHNALTFSLDSPSDTMCYKSEGMYENDTSGDDDMGEVATSVSLSSLASSKRNGGETKIEVWNNSGESTCHRIYLNLSD